MTKTFKPREEFRGFSRTPDLVELAEAIVEFGPEIVPDDLCVIIRGHRVLASIALYGVAMIKASLHPPPHEEMVWEAYQIYWEHRGWVVGEVS